MRRRALLVSSAVALTGSAHAEVRVLLDALTIEALARPRTLRLYLPPSYDARPERRYPVLYLHDGQNLFDAATAHAGEWGVDETLDALARGHGFEAIAVGIDHGGVHRIAEMLPAPHGEFRVAQGEDYIDFVARRVKPWVDARFRTRPEREHTAIGGASLGALMAHLALLRHPALFGRAALLSPAYWTAPSLFDAAALAPGTRVCLYAGDAESSSMVPLVQRMHALLRAMPGVASTLHVAPGARHEESAWRAELPHALRWLFALR